jgi:DNA-binding transcriptional LysR family regulator
MSDVDSVLESSGRLGQRISDLHENRIGRLSIGYFGTAGTQWMPELVSYLENRHPDVAVQLNLAEGPWTEFHSDVQVVIADSEDPVFPSQVESHFLTEDPYVVAVPDDHPPGLASGGQPRRAGESSLDRQRHRRWSVPDDPLRRLRTCRGGGALQARGSQLRHCPAHGQSGLGSDDSPAARCRTPCLPEWPSSG